MEIDELILSLKKMDYKKAEYRDDGEGGIFFSWPKGESSFIAYQVLEGSNEWLIDVKPAFVWDYSPEVITPVVRFYCVNDNVGAYLFSDTRFDADFKDATCAASVESIGDLAYLLNSKFFIAVANYARTSNAKN